MLRFIVFAAVLAAWPAIAGPARDPLSGRPLDDLPIAPPPLHAPDPEYPLSALASAIEGHVRLAYTLNAKGEVERADVAEESPADMLFGISAAYTLRGWRFPEGAPGRYRIKINFKIHGGVPPDLPPPPPPAPEPIRQVDPIYPHIAETVDATSGAVVLDVTLTADGGIADIAVAHELPRGYNFAAAAERAVRQWVFPPVKPGVYRVVVKFIMVG